MALSAFVLFLVLAAMAAYNYDELFHLVGSVVVGATVLVVGTCYFSSPRAWLFRLLQAAAAAALLAEASVVVAEATEASAKEITQMRAQMGLLEQQLRGTEARVRDSEIHRETEKKRHERKVRDLDAQLATVSRRIKESLLAKDRALVECRQWRRKFEDLEHLQQQAQENPVRGKGRPRWAPAKKYGVRKVERGRPDKKLTAVAQVAIVNAAWESKQVRFESEARDYVARTSDQLRSLRAAVTALSEENASLLRKQQTQATHGIPHELAQQQVKDAVRSTMEFADKEHRERVNSLEQTHREELMAAKAGYEGELAKATAALNEAKASAVPVQQLQTIKGELAAKEVELDQLRTAYAKTAADLQVEKEAHGRLDGEMEVGTRDYVKCVQQRDGYLRAHNKLQDRYDKLQCRYDDVVGEKEKEVKGLDEAATYLADEGEKLRRQVEKLKKVVKEKEDDNRVLLKHNTELLCSSVVSNIELQQTRGRVGNLERQVADFEAADITEAVGSMQFGGPADGEAE